MENSLRMNLGDCFSEARRQQGKESVDS